MPQRILIKVVDKFDVERISASKSQETYAEDRCVGSQEQSYKCDLCALVQDVVKVEVEVEARKAFEDRLTIETRCGTTLVDVGIFQSHALWIDQPDSDYGYTSSDSCNNRDNDSYYRFTARNDNNFKLSNSHGSNNRVNDTYGPKNEVTATVVKIPLTESRNENNSYGSNDKSNSYGSRNTSNHAYGSSNSGTDSYGSRDKDNFLVWNDNDNNGTSSYGSNSERDPGSYGLKNEYDNNLKPYGSSQSSMKSYIDKGVAYAAQKAGYSVNTSEKIGDVIPGKLGIEGGLLILPQASGDGVVIGQ
ncbi:hypothetical protein FB446DRAFT_706213 [Lentinula raphanica]|nr:hypothetical protein FB446DRAFT_706213 [Lentinula raphanica]